MTKSPTGDAGAILAEVLSEVRRIGQKVDLLYVSAQDARERIGVIEGRMNRLPCAGTGEHCAVTGVPQ